jgi:hypothetical protein
MDWLRERNSQIGGEKLVRRQLNIFVWNGVRTQEAAAAKAAERAKPPPGVPAFRHTPPPVLCYEGWGTWRACTVRDYNPTNLTYELK